MGHRLSKTTLAGSNVATNKSQRKRNSAIIQSITNRNSSQSESGDSTLNASHHEQTSNAGTLGPTINVNAHLRLEARTDPNYSPSPRQIIIKIQLAKMESGDNDAISSPSNSNIDSVATVTTTANNNNLNIERSNLMVNAISFPRNIACDQGNEIKLNNLDAGTSVLLNNNNFVSNFAAVPYIDNDSDDARNWTNVQKLNMMMRQMYIDNGTGSQQGNNNNESGSNRSSTSSSELNDIVPDISAETSLCSNATRTRRLEEESHCCREKKLKSSSSSSSSTSSNSVLTTPSTKWQCCKCTCRNALKIFRPSTSKKFNQLPTSGSNSNKETQPLIAASTQSISTNEMPPAANNHLTLWSGNDVIFPLAPQQILVVQYPPASHLVTLGSIAHLDEHGLRLVAGDLAMPTTPESSTSMAPSPGSTISSVTTPNGTVVHSQVDYIHCLVPDLEKITKSTFYWGKMDRYEAERLLEGKAEGTFLLRDSAQEEYLFSVTFRKYGRSLHARIEQFNHRFSFDCHDPGVYTAETITGLLEHYKDPSCVMFFEPMLTIPLHRNTTFSLQQLCRATIVSNTTYDGINEMEIPSRLKSYLKEYHYKQRVRVKPLDEPLYSCT